MHPLEPLNTVKSWLSIEEARPAQSLHDEEGERYVDQGARWRQPHEFVHGDSSAHLEQERPDNSGLPTFVEQRDIQFFT